MRQRRMAREPREESLRCIGRRTALLGFTCGRGSRGLAAAAAGQESAGTQREQTEAGGLRHGAVFGISGVSHRQTTDASARVIKDQAVDLNARLITRYRIIRQGANIKVTPSDDASPKTATATSAYGSPHLVPALPRTPANFGGPAGNDPAHATGVSKILCKFRSAD